MLQMMLATSLLTIASLQVNAASVTECGTDVCFTYDNATLFGSANIIGNNIFFLPTNFIAESNNGDGAASANSTLSILVEAITEGFAMTQFVLQEQGDYFLSGSSASASVGGMFAATSGTKTCESMFFPCREEEILNSSPLTTLDAFDDWSINSVISLAGNESWNSDSKVFLTIENRLSATTLENGDQAFIQKKVAGVGITVVPVPAAVWLMGSALGILGWMRRKSISIS